MHTHTQKQTTGNPVFPACSPDPANKRRAASPHSQTVPLSLPTPAHSSATLTPASEHLLPYPKSPIPVIAHLLSSQLEGKGKKTQTGRKKRKRKRKNQIWKVAPDWLSSPNPTNGRSRHPIKILIGEFLSTRE